MAGILPFGAVFIELFFILSVSKHDFSIKNFIFVGPDIILSYYIGYDLKPLIIPSWNIQCSPK